MAREGDDASTNYRFGAFLDPIPILWHPRLLGVEQMGRGNGVENGKKMNALIVLAR